MSALDQKDQNKLTIMLSDERYGNVGHAGSNAQQLLAAGFNPKGAVFLPVLIDKPLEETVEKYNRLISQWLEQSQIIIGQLGIGADGHTVGILPYSPATAVKEAFVTNYPADDYSRITITFPALRRISTAYVFAYGNSKQFTLKLLKEKDLPLEEQPAQILKAIPITYIYNDELEGEA
jgi:6-phosphogluconolactonase/glucosamine-6-phosphate isomerase/deaminase